MNSISPFSYTIGERENTRKVRLNFSIRKGLVVSVPKGFGRGRVERILIENQDQVQEAIGRVQRRLKSLAPQKIQLRAIGKDWEVEYRATSSPWASVIEQEGNILLVQGSIDHEYTTASALQRWLARKAHAHLVPWLGEISKESALPFGKVLVKGQRTRWGSCSGLGTISINRSLLFLPGHLVRYVLIHELVHTRQLDHSPKFWRMLQLREPDCQELDVESKGAWCYVPMWACPE